MNNYLINISIILSFIIYDYYYFFIILFCTREFSTFPHHHETTYFLFYYVYRHSSCDSPSLLKFLVVLYCEIYRLFINIYEKYIYMTSHILQTRRDTTYYVKSAGFFSFLKSHTLENIKIKKNKTRKLENNIQHTNYVRHVYMTMPLGHFLSIHSAFLLEIK